MLGYDHATMGAMAGVATCPTHHSLTYEVSWVAAWSVMALWADFDAPGSTASRTFGAATRSASKLVALVSGGHRWGTHDVILAPALLYWLIMPAALSVLWGRYSVVAILLALALRTLLPRGTFNAPTSLAIALLGTWWAVSHNYDQVLPLTSIAAWGIIVHCLGDLPTTEGLPVPLVWIINRRARFSLGLFKVGGYFEARILAPVMSLALLAMVDQRFTLPWLPIHLHLLPDRLPIHLPF